MKKHNINRMITILAVCSLSFLSVSANAAKDEFQRQMTQQVLKAKQKLKEAEAATGAEKVKLMEEHMKMMGDTMGKMQKMKPKSGMTMQEHEDWINEHQKLMDDLMGQMMKEHHMQKEMGCMSADTHKH